MTIKSTFVTVAHGKRIVLHIGPPKTGSSAIQKFLLENIKKLEERRIWYPTHDIDINGISSGNCNAILSINVEGNYYLEMKKLNTLLDEFYSSSYKILLLSSEAFFRLAEDILRAVPHCEVIAYVRNPIEFLQSIYNQSVKRHFNTEKMQLPSKLGTFQLNRLKQIVESNPGTQFEFFAYSNTDLSIHSVCQDLTSYLELPIENNVSLVNSSYKHEALQFKRVLNHFNLKDIDAKIDTVLQAYSKSSDTYSYIPPLLYKRYYEECLDALARFNAEHVIHNYSLLKSQVAVSNDATFKREVFDEVVAVNVVNFIKKENKSLYYDLCVLLSDFVHENDEAMKLRKVVLSTVNKHSLFSRVMKSIHERLRELIDKIAYLGKE